MAHLQSSMRLTMIYKQKINQNPYLIKFTITLTKIKNFLKKMSFQLVFKTDYSLGILNVLR